MKLADFEVYAGTWEELSQHGLKLGTEIRKQGDNFFVLVRPPLSNTETHKHTHRRTPLQMQPKPKPRTKKQPSNAQDEDLSQIIKSTEFDVILLFAKDDEMKWFKNHTGFQYRTRDVEEEHFTFASLESGKRLGLLVPEKMGPIHMACLASRVVSKFQPGLIGLVGVMAGTHKVFLFIYYLLLLFFFFGVLGVNERCCSHKTDIGDVIMPETIYDWDAGKIDGEVKFRELKAAKADSNVMKIARTMKSSGRTIHFEPIFSGGAVVSKKGFLEELKATTDRKIIGYEMEGNGFYTALETFAVPYFFAKGVCDFAEDVTQDKQEKACVAASAVALQLINTFLA